MRPTKGCRCRLSFAAAFYSFREFDNLAEALVSDDGMVGI